MGLTVNRQIAKKSTVKNGIFFTVNREMSKPKLADVKFLVLILLLLLLLFFNKFFKTFFFLIFQLFFYFETFFFN